MDLHRLGGLLARWHQWRKHYSPERSYARQGGPADPEDELEQSLMVSVEQAVVGLPPQLQRVIGQIARAECMGVECDPGEDEHPNALQRLRSHLIAAGVL